MNNWVFTSLLPYVNKDVELLSDFKDKKTLVKWKCRKCGEEFETQPLSLLNGRLHSAKPFGKCKYSIGNKMQYGSDEYKALEKHLMSIWQQYYHYYDFLEYYRGQLKIRVKSKQTGEVFFIDSRSGNKAKIGTAKKKKPSRLLENQKHTFYDQKTDDMFVGTLREFFEYQNMKPLCKYISALKKNNWFNNRFIICSAKPVKNTGDKSTRIRRTCENKLYCSVRGNECSVCLLDTVPFYTVQEFKALCQEMNPSLEIGEFTNRYTPMECKCKECGCVFYKMPKDLLTTVRCLGCADIASSRLIEFKLNKKHIYYEVNKEFKDLPGVTFSFYLPDYNTVLEYKGITHYRPIIFKGEDSEQANERYEQIKRLDGIRSDYCNKNGILFVSIDIKSKSIERSLTGLLRRIKEK